MPVLRTILTLSLLLISIPLLAHARPKTVQAPSHAVLMQQLTPEELACRAGGILIQAIAVDRDAFVPLTTTIARLRLLLATSSREYERNMVEIAQLLYQAPAMPGARARQAFEIGCVTVTTPVNR